jgi:uncharacterized membrane protein YraQ (UPF0718 family)
VTGIWASMWIMSRAALLLAGPAINLPSLLVIGRFSSWRVAVALAAVVWGIAATGGVMLR